MVSETQLLQTVEVASNAARGDQPYVESCDMTVPVAKEVMQGPRDLPPLVPLSTQRDRSGEPEHLLAKLDKLTAQIPGVVIGPPVRWDDISLLTKVGIE